MFHDDPTVAAALVAILALLVVGQRRLGPRLAWPNRVRREILPVLDSVIRPLGRPLTREKDAGEYVCSVNASRYEVQKALYDDGFRRNMLSTLKFILLATSQRVFERGSWVFRESLFGKWMFHCYFFGAAEQGFQHHLNGHMEINYLHSPSGHTGSERYAGDPNRHIRDALDAAGITWVVLESPGYRAIGG